MPSPSPSPSSRILAALLISLAISVSAIGQTKTATADKSKPGPSRPLSVSNAPAAAARQAPAPPAPAQPSYPAIAQTPANSPASSPMSQSIPAPVNGQAGVPPQTPAVTLSVDYRNGLLSVVADKAELGKVLQMVGSKIGTSIEIAPEVAAYPVAARIKPATPAQVLAQLLDGPQLEYIVIGSDESGRVLNRVIVRRRSSFAQQPLVATRTASVAAQEPGTK